MCGGRRTEVGEDRAKISDLIISDPESYVGPASGGTVTRSYILETVELL